LQHRQHKENPDTTTVNSRQKYQILVMVPQQDPKKLTFIGSTEHSSFCRILRIHHQSSPKLVFFPVQIKGSTSVSSSFLQQETTVRQKKFSNQNAVNFTITG
jgi:hypothetical protein